MKQIINEFCDNIQMNTNISERTIRGYKIYLRKVLGGIGQTIPSEEQVKKYMLTLRKSGYSVSYINNISVAVEKYMKFVGKEIHLPKFKRHNQVIIDTLTPGEIARIIAAANDSRKKCIVGILAYSGIRVKELCNLKVGDVNFKEGTLIIRNGKGGVSRIAYISKEGLSLVAQYLKDFPRDEDSLLFTTLAKGNKYNGNAVRKLLRKLARLARIDKRVYPHLLRHSLATNLLNRGVNLMTIQSILGHKHLESTLIYAHSAPHRVNMEYNYYVPSYL